MAVLGIDFGDRKVGLAKAALGTPAMPLRVVTYRRRADLLEQIAAMCREEGVTEIVVGLPLGMAKNGAEDSPAVVKVRKFVHNLKAAVGIPVYLHDERLTTREANRLRQGRHGGAEDAVAAMLMLQSFIDSRLHSS